MPISGITLITSSGVTCCKLSNKFKNGYQNLLTHQEVELGISEIRWEF
jgi:hypothetical protein